MSNGRFSLKALYAMALVGLGLGDLTNYSERPMARGGRKKPGFGKKRYHVVNTKGKRVPLPAGSSRPACKFIPNLRGLRYERGQYVAR